MNREQLEQINGLIDVSAYSDGSWRISPRGLKQRIAALPYFSAAPSDEGVDYKAAYLDLEAWIKSHHNGYNPECRKLMPLSEPPTLIAALEELFVEADELVAPSPATEGGERPERPPMLYGRYGYESIGARWFSRLPADQGFWCDLKHATVRASEDIVVYREHSDPEALALYDAERQQREGSGQ